MAARGGTGGGLRGLVGLLTFLQLGVALAVILITHFKLGHVSQLRVNGNSYESQGQCYLGPDGSAQLCVYSYTIGCVSIVATLLWSIFLCCTCDLCGCSAVFEVIFSGLGTAWWVIAGIILMRRAREANDQGVAMGLYNWRNSVWILCWVAVALFALTAILSIIRVFQQLANCCGGRREPKVRGSYA